jgi:hypothetical protein
VESLLSYLGKVFTVTPTIFNDLWIGELYRVSIVADAFLEEGKVRNPKFLSYPPLDIIRSRGVYNRANSPETTVFYAAESESVAIREVKPGTGQRIVLATWVNRTQSPLLAYPLCLTAGIENEYADRSTYAFEQFCKNWPPLISEWAESILSFIAQEFIKEQEQVHPKRYDYLYSAFFADRILQPFPEGSKVDSYECLVYPSVAGKHVPSNVAIRPEVVDNKLTLIKAREFEVMETRYDRALRHNELPARLKLLRESKIISNNRIIWDDDCT